MNYLTSKPRNMILVLLFVFVTCECLSIGTVSDRNVTKRDAKVDFYPDWVPFKNKKGEELGEFVQVETKAKPKKRLAPPVNFVLRAVADSEGDDYYDKGQGESDSEDYFEKKEWSDVNRPVIDFNKDINHTHISDIGGVVGIITKTNPLTEVLKNQYKKSTENKETTDDSDKDKATEKDESEEVQTTSKKSKPNIITEDKKQEGTEDDGDYEEASSEKRKPETTEEDQTESEATKKARILGSVDELKERHAQEQRILSETLKEEEMFKEELERDTIQSGDKLDKYGLSAPRTKTVDYDEYDTKDSAVQEKYKIKPHRKLSTSTRPPKRTSKRVKSPKKEKHVETGKLSVFKNPRAYMIYDDSDSVEQPITTTTTTISPKITRRPAPTLRHLATRRPAPTSRYSSRYTTAPPDSNSEETVRISLVPDENDSKEGEPTLFFPKKTKNKRRRKGKTTQPISDSSGAETVAKLASNVTAVDMASKTTDTTASDTTASVATAPSAVDTAASTVEGDAVPAPSDKKEAKKGNNFDNLKSVDRHHHSEHEEIHEEHGKKAYEGVHKDTKTEEGHHDKEDHLGKYNDHGGVDKEHHDEKGHYGIHHHEEHGKKHAKYEESGKHSKGHSTKGSHDIHKKEEYEKKVEFFEEEGDSAEEEKHGGDTHEREHKSGGHFKKGDLKADHHGHSKGESGHFAEGGHGHGHKGHKGSGGHDSHGKHGADQFSKGGKESGKKWIYHHGHPAKTANLVVVDRRTDQFQHGPMYYG